MPSNQSVNQSVDRSVNRSVDQSINQSINQSIESILTDWLIAWLIDSTDRLTGWRTDWLIDRLTDWLTDWLDWLAGWPPGWLTDWLNGICLASPSYSLCFTYVLWYSPCITYVLLPLLFTYLYWVIPLCVFFSDSYYNGVVCVFPFRLSIVNWCWWSSWCITYVYQYVSYAFPIISQCSLVMMAPTHVWKLWSMFKLLIFYYSRFLQFLQVPPGCSSRLLQVTPCPPGFSWFLQVSPGSFSDQVNPKDERFVFKFEWT